MCGPRAYRIREEGVSHRRVMKRRHCAEEEPYGFRKQAPFSPFSYSGGDACGVRRGIFSSRVAVIRARGSPTPDVTFGYRERHLDGDP